MDQIVRPPVEPAAKRVRTAKAPFRRMVAVCGRCARKLDGEGFGRKGRQPLRKALKAELKGGRWGRKVRLVETSCLGLCPKRRQVVAAPGDLAAGRLVVAEPGASASAVLERLFGPPQSNASPLASETPGA